MTTKEKLFLMKTIDERNTRRINEFTHGTKKHWLVSFAVMKLNTKNEVEQEEGEFTVVGLSIEEALNCADFILLNATEQFHWVKFSIWNIGIMEDEIF